MRKHPEKFIQNTIQMQLRALGYLSIHIPNMGFFNPRTRRYNILPGPFFLPGVPDLVVLLPESKVLWIEVKAPGGSRSPAHIRMADEILPRYGHKNNYVLAYNPESVQVWLKAAGYKHLDKS